MNRGIYFNRVLLIYWIRIILCISCPIRSTGLFLRGEWGKYFSEDQGRPSLSIRLMVGLHYLKSIYKESDESVVSKFKENAYWQYFCGFEYFQYSDPCNATSLVHWRKRFGREGVELLLKETLGVTRRSGELGRRDLRRG